MPGWLWMRAAATILAPPLANTGSVKKAIVGMARRPGIILWPMSLENGCTLADLIAEVLADDPSTADVVQVVVDVKAQGIITGRELGAILRGANSP